MVTFSESFLFVSSWNKFPGQDAQGIQCGKSSRGIKSQANPLTKSVDSFTFAYIYDVPSRGVQLRWEMYNIFNHTNFDDIDGAMVFGLVQFNPNPTLACTAAGNTCSAIVKQTRTTFGTPTTARTPRVMQASIRINF